VSAALVVGGRRAVLEAVRAGRTTTVLLARGARGTPGLRELLDAATAGGISVIEVERSELDALDADHHGVAARVHLAETIDERGLSSWSYTDDAIVVLLDGITDPHNLGASARSAEAAGAEMLVTRTRRAADVTSVALRASAGALFHLPHARVANLTRALERLKDAGFTVVGLDEGADPAAFERPCPQGRLAVVLGAEGEGISRLVRESCDVLMSLPVRGRVSSLNASAALAAALYAYVLPSRRT
jgi:23S rRNA (guanosine2251-2'-O)-methyltransferase